MPGDRSPLGPLFLPLSGKLTHHILFFLHEIIIGSEHPFIFIALDDPAGGDHFIEVLGHLQFRGSPTELFLDLKLEAVEFSSKFDQFLCGPRLAERVETA